ncbi:MAG: hypothetical protein F6K00_18570 [Leptolyngbya sp. SIOISBB]|nr:hypothetical protein [Leptolyngbya sp. SIOISBB]
MSLIITGVIDGPLAGGTPKAIELFALADIPDLSIYGVGSASNGGGTDGQEFTLSGLASAGDFIYISFEATQFQNFLGFAPTFTSATAPNINGNDAIELFQNSTVIDVFGDINTDGSGEPWEYMDGWAYRRGNTTPDGTTFNLANWTFSSPSALTGETTNFGAATPFPTGVFNSNVAPVLSVNATFSAINEDIAAASNIGNTVEELVSALITDADFDPEGIAVTNVDNTNGTWQYSLDGGTTWLSFGALSETNATMLGATSLYSGYLNQDPTGQNWLAFANVDFTPPLNTATQTVDEIGVTLNTTADEDIYAGYSNYSLNPLTGQYTLVNNDFPELDSSTGYTIAFNAQVLSDAQSNPSRAGFSLVVVSDDPTKAIEIAFQDDKIFAQDDVPLFVEDAGVTTAFDTTQATQYSLKVQNDAYQLFADGNNILSGTLRDYTAFSPTPPVPDPYETPNFLFFGDDTTSGQGSFRLNQVTVETPTRIRFQPNTDYNGSANIQFRAWDTTDGSSNGQTGVDASLTGGINPFSNTLGTGTITVTPQGGGGTPPGVPGGDSANAIFNFEQWVSLVAIRTGQVYQSALVDFNVEMGGIRIAPLFDEADYLSENPDVAIAVQQGIYQYGFEHFVLFGLSEGRTPSNWFDEQYYLAQNADVAAAVSRGQTTAIAHFLQIGHRENRDPSAFFDASDYLLKNPDVKAAVDAGLLDSGFEHYIESGAEEGRLNGLLFEESFYLKQNPDVVTAVQKGEFALGLYHFLAIGQIEGRDPSSLFDQSAYLARYGDVAAAVAGGVFASGFEHYVLFGRAEGRITA